jgi:putative hydrolase of the HAD superfamily
MIPLDEGINILKTVKARGYRVYILSNMSQAAVAIIKQRYDFFKLCDGEVWSCTAHAAKPDVAIYQILLKQYNLDPAECLFIDDRPLPKLLV